jgi:AbrB family looped-hinge helix DNA binding protein
MSKVTSKLQVTIPKAIADQFGIRPGNELDWIPAGDGLRVVSAAQKSAAEDTALRLRLFDQATARQRDRESSRRRARPKGRGWTREGLYGRGLPR